MVPLCPESFLWYFVYFFLLFLINIKTFIIRMMVETSIHKSPLMFYDKFYLWLRIIWFWFIFWSLRTYFQQVYTGIQKEFNDYLFCHIYKCGYEEKYNTLFYEMEMSTFWLIWVSVTGDLMLDLCLKFMVQRTCGEFCMSVVDWHLIIVVLKPKKFSQIDFFN